VSVNKVRRKCIKLTIEMLQNVKASLDLSQFNSILSLFSLCCGNAGNAAVKLTLERVPQRINHDAASRQTLGEKGKMKQLINDFGNPFNFKSISI
jgi:hypothetical protein